mmetsp:Transcript_1959/g.3712  ORF Transcript_1959/g.3712 Transcript_1959/m.3712 type:complete len:104 (-) Transcript_1959:821-1132(-)
MNKDDDPNAKLAFIVEEKRPTGMMQARELVGSAIQAKADVNCTNSFAMNGDTPLIEASRRGKFKIVKCLLRAQGRPRFMQRLRRIKPDVGHVDGLTPRDVPSQ